MSTEGGPWAHMTPEPERPKPPPAPARKVFAWPIALVIVGFAGLVLAMAKAFPEARLSGQDWGDAAYLGGFALIVAAGLWSMRQARPMRILRHAAIWVAIAGVLAVGFAYKDEIAAVPQRLAIAFGTGRPAQVGDHELVVSQDAEGAFTIVGEVNGQPVRFMVDTGASETVLAPEDARRLGVDLGALKFDHMSETANGKGYGAPFTASELKVGPIRLTDFKMEINKAPMSSSLLGLSFLNRLESFRIEGRKLYLKWRT
jgi:aspartyl protease family protein